MRRKIIFLYNNYERERWIIDLISQSLVQYGCDVYKVGFTESDMLRKVLHIWPKVIVTYPITTISQINAYTVIKKLTGSIILTFTTEGLANYNADADIKSWAGVYNYSSDLIDYHIYWGKLPAKKIGKELYLQNKLKSVKQIRVFGNPMYEKNKIQSLFPYKKNEKIIQNYKNSVLVLTGFSFSEYTLKEIIGAQDIVNIDGKTKQQILEDPKLKEAIKAKEYEGIYCQKYIDAVLKAARQNEDTLFIIKLHPHEIFRKQVKKEPKYIQRFKNYKNILIIDESWPIGAILRYCKLLVHYGSTVDLEAYIYGVPTLKLEYNVPYVEGLCSSVRLTSSTYYENVENISAIDNYVKGIKNGIICFKKNKQTEKQLQDIMNYKVGYEYNPSEKIAQFLCTKLHRNNLHLTLSEWKKLFKVIG